MTARETLQSHCKLFALLALQTLLALLALLAFLTLLTLLASPGAEATLKLALQVRQPRLLLFQACPPPSAGRASAGSAKR